MTTAYLPTDWTGFGTAAATAAAALAGLLFIAVSINLKRILEYPSLPTRAAQTLIMFVTALVTALLVVVPGQARIALGLEFIATGLVIGGFLSYLAANAERGSEDTRARQLLGEVLPLVTTCGCLVIAGATLLGQAGGGLYWLVPSVLAALVFGLINVWVLLVEILR